MPTIYQGVCASCGHTTKHMTSSYGAVLVDKPVDAEQHEVLGMVVGPGSDGRIESVRDSRFVVLSHPGDSRILEGIGYTWTSVL